jgi:hypothetical protein
VLLRSLVIGAILLLLCFVVPGLSGWLLLFGFGPVLFASVCYAEWGDHSRHSHLSIFPLALLCHGAGLLIFLKAPLPELGAVPLRHLATQAPSILAGALVTGLLFIASHRLVFGFPSGARPFIVASLASILAVSVWLGAEELRNARPWLGNFQVQAAQVAGVYIFAWFVGLPLAFTPAKTIARPAA